MPLTRIAVFGSTGSIGRSTLEVVANLGDRFRVTILAAHHSVDQICTQATRYQPESVVLTDPAAAEKAKKRLGSKFQVLSGPRALIDVLQKTPFDILVMAMSGTEGVGPVLKALAIGKRVALATKEILVAYGAVVMEKLSRSDGELLPIDSELTALHQCLNGKDITTIRRLIITASGGPFWRKGCPPNPTINMVLHHPTWKMGKKITVDSATMMNKGLEVISAVRLFGIPPANVKTVIHPEAVVHSLIEFQDSSVLAQLSYPDMRLPIHYCLTYPERVPSQVPPLRLESLPSLRFFPVPLKRFPCLGLAYKAVRAGPTAPCVLNASNEVAVQAFLKNEISFRSIPAIIRSTLNAHIKSTESNTQGSRLNAPRSMLFLRRVEAWGTEFARGLLGRYHRLKKQ